MIENQHSTMAPSRRGTFRNLLPAGRKITSIQAKATQALAVAALVVIAPFAVNNFIQGRHLVGAMSVIISMILAIIAVAAARGRHYPAITLFLLIPAIVGFFIISFRNQGLVAAFWCYPAVLSFYFMLTERQAWVANTILLCAMLPSSWLLIDPDYATRFTATLLSVSLFSAIFMRIISRQQQQLAQRDQLRREGMASVSHELRTPLAMLLAQAEAMRDGVRPRDDVHFEKLSRAMEHMNGLVDDLYQLTLADAGALHCVLEPVNWSEIVLESIEANRERFRDRALRTSIAIEDQVLVLGDEKRLRQIIDNLLANCLRYCPATSTVSVRLEQEGRHGRLTVSDNGPGVNDQALERLFERFYRAEASRSRSTGGAGLGLALVKAFVDAHDGKATATRSPEGGLAITISIPLYRRSGAIR